jgi:hypothetical protein
MSALLLFALLAACTGTANGPRSTPTRGARSVPPTTPAPQSTASPRQPAPSSAPPVILSVPADVPTTGPNVTAADERPPVMPVEATLHSRAGAQAFAVFFIETIDWAYATTSSAYMRHYFDHRCIGCRSIAHAIEGARAKRRHFIGDRLTIKAATVRSASGQRGDRLIVLVRFDVTSGEVVSRSNRFIDGSPALSNYGERLLLQWKRAWRVVELEVAV